MEVVYNTEVDVLHVLLGNAPVEARVEHEHEPGVVLEYDGAGNVVGVAMLDASKRMQDPRSVTGTYPEGVDMTPNVINIDSATWIGDYRIRLQFDDATTQDVDFGPFLSRSLHPVIRTYLDPARFQTFRVIHGELIWGNYELSFPIMDLYNNRIVKHGSFESVA